MAGPEAAGGDGPVFVLGCPRSGTTLLQLMLHGHPRLAIAPETRFLLPAYESRLRFGDLEVEANRRALGEFVVSTRAFGKLRIDRQATVERIVEAPATVGSAIGTVFRAYADRFDRPRWGEKRPAYHRHIELVMRLFPDAHIVHVLRDPRDCVASLKEMPWWNHSTYHSVSSWAQSIDYTDEAARRWPVTRVRYERLVADPEGELRPLCEALGEEYEPAMARPEELGQAVLPRRWWHRNTRERPSTERIGRWQGRIEPWELALCESALAERMQATGYEPTGAAGPGALHLARYEAVHRSHTLSRRVKLARDGWKRRSEPNPVAARLTSGQLVAAGLAGESFQ